MYTLRIRHPVSDYDRWKEAFDRDPLDRRRSGVVAYTINRAVIDADVVEVDLQFATRAATDAMLERLLTMWTRAPAGIAAAPQTWLLETVEQGRYE